MVAPPAGAWIETITASREQSKNQSRAPRGRVDRNIINIFIINIKTSRAPRGRVDRNLRTLYCLMMPDSRAPRGRVDRNWISCKTREKTRVAPPAGAWIETWCWSHVALVNYGRAPRGRVDRNNNTSWVAHHPSVAPPAGAWIETRIYKRIEYW